MLKRRVKEEPVVQLTDLRGITRNSKFCKTVIWVITDPWDRSRVEWILCGESRLCPQKDSSRSDGRWRLEAYLTAGVTDFEHDSAYAFKLPLIGVQFDGVSYGRITVQAWIDPNEDPEDVGIPLPGYNPMNLPEAFTCKEKSCGKPHRIIPEGYYGGPPADPKLYEALRGKKVEILFSPVFPEEDE